MYIISFTEGKVIGNKLKALQKIKSVIRELIIHKYTLTITFIQVFIKYLLKL